MHPVNSCSWRAFHAGRMAACRIIRAVVMPLMVLAMVLVVASANYLVQFPVNDWLTWGGLTYPVSYFVTDLTNRRFGTTSARRVVYIGFVLAVVASIWVASPRIAIASGMAFLVSQLMDVAIFNRLKEPLNSSARAPCRVVQRLLSKRAWWQPPLFSSVIGSAVDTALFFALAFWGTTMPWVTLAIGDYGVKVAIALALLLPWRVVTRRG